MMKLRKTTSALAITALAAVLGTVALAQQGPMDAPGPMGPMMLTQFDAMDADKDGKVTQAEMDAFRAARFAEADADKDGLLNSDEMAAMHLKQMQARMPQMMARMDANNDGKLSPEEMPGAQRGPRMFDMLDADNDGAVTKDEMQAAQDWMQDRGGKRGGRMGHGNHGCGDGGGWWN